MSRNSGTKEELVGARWGEYERARSALERLLQVDQNSEGRARLERLQAQLSLLTQEFKQRTEAARARWPRRKAPKSPDDFRGLIAAGWGDSNVEHTREKKEVASARLHLHSRPDDAGAYYDLSVAYRHLGSYEEAVEACKEAIRLKPDFAEAHCSLGVIYGKLGRHEEALDSLTQAIRLMPDNVRAQYNLGVASVAVGNRDAGLAVELFLGPDYRSARIP